jgi:hypothetical protein
MKARKIASALLTISLIAASFIAYHSEEAKADLWCWPWESSCKVDGVVNSSNNDIFGFPKAPRGDESCLMMVTSSSYKFQIINYVPHEVYFKVNNKQYKLEPQMSTQFNLPASYSSSSCSVQNYPPPNISFDGSYQPEYQGVNYTLSKTISSRQTNKPTLTYVFTPNENGIDLYAEQ